MSANAYNSEGVCQVSCLNHWPNFISANAYNSEGVRVRLRPGFLVESLRESKMVSSNILLSIKIRFAKLEIYLKGKYLCESTLSKISLYP